MNTTLHIVCLDAPSPPDYGGAIDMYYKIVALAGTGRKIILHYFDYKKNRSAEGLENYCQEIHTYERKSFLRSLSFVRPYITGSRIDRDLIKRLNADQHPVLLEGIHCAGLLPHLNDPSRAVVRMHNEEAAYYERLAGSATQPVKKLYYRYEAAAIKRFYRQINPATKLACLSITDEAQLKEKFGFRQTAFVPAFVPWTGISSLDGKGDYCLYHGNLSVDENHAAALWLVNEVFAGLDIPLVIAGSGASPGLVKTVSRHPHIRLIADPPVRELDLLVRDAHIHVLPSFNTTGVKLKLLHALFDGRFCVVNSQGVKGSGLEGLVTAADTAGDFASAVAALWKLDFTEEDKKNRRQMQAVYDNELNAQKLNALW